MPAAFVRQLGALSVKVAGTTLATNFGATTTAGNLIVAEILFDNAATASKPVVSSISKPGGETATWVSLGAARSTSTSAGAFSSGELWCIKTTVAWAAPAITVTVDTSTTMIATQFLEFSGVNATQRSTAGTNYSTTTTAASATTTGTTPQVGDLAIGFLFGSNVAAIQAGDNDTTGGSWSAPISLGIGSTGSSGATNNYGLAQYKILTAASQQTFNNQAAMPAGNGAIVAILQAVPPPAITQASYRFYGDGTEAGSTALAAQDTSYSANVSAGNVSLLLRVRLQSTTVDNVLPTDDFLLQCEKNGSGTWKGLAGLFDSYPEYNSDFTVALTTSPAAEGQSFLGDGGALARVGFFLDKVGAPPGNLTATLYAHTGTFGTSTGTGTGSPLATSTARAATSLQTAFQWEYFDFDGTVTLANGTPYVIVVGPDTTGDASNTVNLRFDASAATHPGIHQTRNAAAAWFASTNQDTLFRVYSTGAPADPFSSANLTHGAATTNRLGAGTGSFEAGKVAVDGLVTQLGWTGNNYTELLYALTLLSAAVANGDTLRFRVLRNSATTGLTYTLTPTVTVTLTTPSLPPRNIHLSNAALQPSFTR